jgi:hypothetical protein
VLLSERLGSFPFGYSPVPRHSLLSVDLKARVWMNPLLSIFCRWHCLFPQTSRI